MKITMDKKECFAIQNKINDISFGLITALTAEPTQQDMMILQMKVEDFLFIQTGVEATEFGRNMKLHDIGKDPEF